MAADTDFHQTRCNSWSHPEIRSESQNNQQAELLAHGSISFGRFAVESLAWEKWSVFSHNKCREELERFMAPGFVAQKKAYFEEYYRRIREMKASQAEQQELETNQPGSEDGVESSASQIETGTDAADSKQENLSSHGIQIQTLESDTSTNFVSSCGDIVEKQEAATRELTSCRSNRNERASTNDEMSNSLCPPETEQSTKEVWSSTHVARDSEISQHARLVSNANKPKTQGNVAAAQSKTRLGYGNSKDGIKSSKKNNTFPQKKNTGKADNSVVLSKSNSHKAADCNNSVQVLSRRRPTEVSSSSTILRTSLVRNRLESSSSRGISDQARANLGQRNVAAAQSKTGLGYGNSKDEIKSSKKTKTSPQKKNIGKADNSAVLSKSNTHKAADCNNSVQVLSRRRPTEVSSSSTILRTSMVRNRLESSSSSGISDQTRGNLGRRDLADKLSRSLPGYGQSVQKTLKESVPSGLKPTAIDNRSKIVPGQNKLSQNVGAQVGQSSHVRERKQKEEEKAKTNVTHQRVPKSTTSAPWSNHKNSKLVQKSTVSRPTNLTNARNEPRLKTPSWR
ncbi:hypothetical protein UlMin_036069 [Ulmus minor]